MLLSTCTRLAVTLDGTSVDVHHVHERVALEPLRLVYLALEVREAPARRHFCAFLPGPTVSFEDHGEPWSRRGSAVVCFSPGMRCTLGAARTAGMDESRA